MTRESATFGIPALALVVLLGSALRLPGQSVEDSKFTAALLKNRYGLSVENGRLSGTGAPVLKSAIAQSRFILLGETHGLAQTSEFWGGVCNAAGPAGFHTMAVEEGPLAAAELEQWARQPRGEAELAAFEKRYPGSINLYNTREEFAALQQCADAAGSGRFRLWGLNQEALGAGRLMLSRIVDTRPRGAAARAIRTLLQKSEDADAKALVTGKISNLFMISANDGDLAAGAALLQNDGSPQARSLFARLIQSHEINKAGPADPRRSRLMKMLFAADYAEATRTEGAPPKVLLKFGAFHIYRGLNPMHASGLGNYVAEFAEGEGAQSLHIELIAVKGSQPIYPKVGQPAVLRPFNLQEGPGSGYLQPLLADLPDSQWTLYDLRPLRAGFNRLGVASPELAELVFGLDLVVLVPEATPSIAIR